MNPASLKGRSLLSWIDYSPEEIRYVLDLTKKVKKESGKGILRQRFRGKTLALLFEQNNTRLRIAFETAFAQEGGHPLFLHAHDISCGAEESCEDTARMLGRMCSAIALTGASQDSLQRLARYAQTPVYNGGTERFSPLQALTDVFTIEEEYTHCKGRTLCYLGDGRKNIAASLMIIASKIGMNITIVAPEQYFPDAEIRQLCEHFAHESGAAILMTASVDEGVRGADAIYTDRWEHNSAAIVSPYQVNDTLMQATGNPACIFLHCLPAVKGQEVTFDVVEGEASRVFNQDENRRHALKAVLLASLGY